MSHHGFQYQMGTIVITKIRWVQNNSQHLFGPTMLNVIVVSHHYQHMIGPILKKNQMGPMVILNNIR